MPDRRAERRGAHVGEEVARISHAALVSQKLGAAKTKQRGGAYEMLAPDACWALPAEASGRKRKEPETASTSTDDELDDEYEDQIDAALEDELATLFASKAGLGEAAAAEVEAEMAALAEAFGLAAMC